MKLRINFMSLGSLKGKTTDEKIDDILSPVKKGQIVVLDGVLEPDEEMRLVEATMGHVSEKFTGIEVATLPRPREITKAYEIYLKLYERLLGLAQKITKKEYQTIQDGLTVVGPSQTVKKIKRDPESFYITAEV